MEPSPTDDFVIKKCRTSIPCTHRNFHLAHTTHTLLLSTFSDSLSSFSSHSLFPRPNLHACTYNLPSFMAFDIPICRPVKRTLGTRRFRSDTCFWLSGPSHPRRGEHNCCLTEWSAPLHCWRCGVFNSNDQRELVKLKGVKRPPTWISRRVEVAGYRCKRSRAERSPLTHQNRNCTRRKSMGLQRLVLAPCLLAWATSVATVHLEPKQPEGYGVPFDYFYLSTTWVPSFCQIEGQNMRHCSFEANNKGFLIHGLWPNFRNGSWPQFCPGPLFRSETINDLGGELEKYWPESLEGLKRDALWKHEWTKHGTCAMSSIPSMHDYFATTLSLFKSLDFYKGFQKGKILPQGGGTYKTREVVKALTHASPAKSAPVIICEDGKLFEVRYCIEKSLNFVSCNAVQASDLHLAACPSTVFVPRELSFPPLNSATQSL